MASSQLAAERGAYQSYKGSKWDRGLLPIDTIRLLAEERGEAVDVDMSMSLDWEPVRASIREHGMRNSNTMAIAPTATISNIQGVSQSIEPIFSNLFVKSNLSGEFTIVNESLVAELEAAGLWDKDLLDEIKYWDGSIQAIERIPYDIRLRYPTAFEVEPEWLIDAAARRQKWIDMGQSLNLYIAEPSGKKLNDMYLLAWKKGVKTTYYLRSRGATSAEKSTIDVNRFGIQPRWMKSQSASSQVTIERNVPTPVEPSPVVLADEPAAPPVAQAAAPVPVTQPEVKPQEPTLQIPVASNWPKPTAGEYELPIVEELDCEACQ
jgi:ribonucleoside-diphosphate reductase alpha chain